MRLLTLAEVLALAELHKHTLSFVTILSSKLLKTNRKSKGRGLNVENEYLLLVEDLHAALQDEKELVALVATADDLQTQSICHQ